MNNIVPARATNVTTIASTDAPNMLALIRRTVAVDTNNDEFDMFINMARALRLDPLRRQIYAMVFNKDKPEKRRMSLIVGIDGFRTIADRTGNYRPDEDEPTIEMSADAKSAVNPAGIVKATVRVFKFSHGEWHRITASAYWEEYAPIKEEWAEGPDGKRRPTGKQTLDTSGQWGKMGRVMLAKVAEALALRKGWPDDFSNVYSEEETDRTRTLDVSATEMIEEHARQERQAKIGGPSLVIDWMDGQALEGVPVGSFAERAVSWIDAGDPTLVAAWADRNRHALREFWAHNKTDANAIKRKVEAAQKRSDVLTGAVLQAG